MNTYVKIEIIGKKGDTAMLNDYIYETDRMVFAHKISKNLPCDSYSTHTHNYYELIYFLDGDATHVIEDRKYKLKKGDLILIHPFRYHFIQIDSPADYERYNILFDIEKHGVESALLIPEDVEVISLAGNAIADGIFRKCEFYYENSDKETFEKILSHLLSELFYNVSLFPAPSAEESGTLSPLISKALAYINARLCEIANIAEVADHLFVSESYLFRLFQKELHRTPKKYIMEKRLLMAQKLISSGEKPTAVCEKCGFSDYTTFYRNYNAFFGCSPSEQR